MQGLGFDWDRSAVVFDFRKFISSKSNDFNPHFVRQGWRMAEWLGSDGRMGISGEDSYVVSEFKDGGVALGGDI